MVASGVCVAKGWHVWLSGGVCGSQGGMHGCWSTCVVARGVYMVAGGVCMVAWGHAWLLGGMHGKGGCAWQRGTCVAKGGVHGYWGVHGC